MPENPYISSLVKTAATLCRPGKGILAADESISTIGRRLTSCGLPNDESTRRSFREILICAPGNEQAYSGVILFQETFYQSDTSGKPFVEQLKEKGIIPGIKVDTGLRPLEGCDGETYTSGLEGLETRCKEYYNQGARFAKWRAALRIDNARSLPSDQAVLRNAEELAQYAVAAQRCALVPIIEPEILIDGEHSQTESARVAQRVIKAVYDKLKEENVVLEGTLLKPMMILPGIGSGIKTNARQVAENTLSVMRDVVPEQVPGIMFLSGGMAEAEATKRLAELNKSARHVPWKLSFSFGRALQTSVMQAWRGRAECVEEAMRIATELGVVNAKATMGVYEGHPSEGGKELYEGFRGWRSGEDMKNN